MVMAEYLVNSSYNLEPSKRFSSAVNRLINHIASGYLWGCKPQSYLCDVEEFVHNKVTESPENPITIHYTGSRAEGIDCAGDDDFMFCNHLFRVFDSVSDLNTFGGSQNHICLIALPTHPGYATLSCTNLADIEKDETLNNIAETLKLAENCGFCRSDNMREVLMEPEEEDDLLSTATPHGPALTDEEANMDFVAAIPCYNWPKQAYAFSTRTRPSGHPNTEVTKTISSLMCFYVCVGHRLSCDPGKEWRLSFSLAEKLLVRSWDTTRIKCYIIIKILIKENLVADSNSVCSYFIKTAIFWLSEAQPASFWNDDHLLMCVYVVLEKLSYFMDEGKLPNYFVPDNNMIDHLEESIRLQNKVKLAELKENLVPLILKSNLCKGMFCNDDAPMKIHYLIVDKGEPQNSGKMIDGIVDNLEKFRIQYKQQNFYDTMHLTLAYRKLKDCFSRHIDIAEIVAQGVRDYLTNVPDVLYREAYERILDLVLASCYHYQAMTLTRAVRNTVLNKTESMYLARRTSFVHPTTYDDNGLLGGACLALFYYTNDNKEKASAVCNETLYYLLDDQTSLEEALKWACAVVLEQFESLLFTLTDPELGKQLECEKVLVVNPVILLMYIGIKSTVLERERKLKMDRFKELTQLLPAKITWNEISVHSSYQILGSLIG